MLIKLIAIIVHSDFEGCLTPWPLLVLTSSFSSQSLFTFMICLNFPDSMSSSLRDIWWHPFCRGTKNTLFSHLNSEALWLHLWIMEILRSSTHHNWSVVAPLRQWHRLVVLLLFFRLLKFYNQSDRLIKRPLRVTRQSDERFVLGYAQPKNSQILWLTCWHQPGQAFPIAEILNRCWWHYVHRGWAKVNWVTCKRSWSLGNTCRARWCAHQIPWIFEYRAFNVQKQRQKKTWDQIR